MQSEQEANFSELKRRGITDEVITAFSISFGTDLPFAFKEGLVIPIRHPNGEFHFNKYRRSYLNNSIKQKYAYDIGSRTALFGADKLTEEHSYVVITEGEMDALVLWSKNIPAVSSTGGAQSFQPDFVDLIENRKVYICYDNDDAGAVGVVKTLELIPDAYVVFVPEVIGVKDISDFCARGGDFHALMQTAKQYKAMEDVVADKHARSAIWAPTRFHDAYIDAHTPKKVEHTGGNNYSGDDALLKAKSVPCHELMEFNRAKKAQCLWHNDSDPSLTYYPVNNNCYCFVCGKFADSVDIVMAQQNIGIKEAIKFLNNNCGSSIK